MSAPVRLAVQRAWWPPFEHVLARASARRGDARVVDGRGAVVADMVNEGLFTIVLPGGMGVELAGVDTPWCACGGLDQRYGCLGVDAAAGGAVMLSGRCPRVLAECLASVLRARGGEVFLELADAGVLPRWYRQEVARLTVFKSAGPPRWDRPPSRQWAPAAPGSGEVAAARHCGAGGRDLVAGGERCASCGRLFSDPLSLQRGRGPVCQERHRRGVAAMQTIW